MQPCLKLIEAALEMTVEPALDSQWVSSPTVRLLPAPWSGADACSSSVSGMQLREHPTCSSTEQSIAAPSTPLRHEETLSENHY